MHDEQNHPEQRIESLLIHIRAKTVEARSHLIAHTKAIADLLRALLLLEHADRAVFDQNLRPTAVRLLMTQGDLEQLLDSHQLIVSREGDQATFLRLLQVFGREPLTNLVTLSASATLLDEHLDIEALLLELDRIARFALDDLANGKEDLS